MSTPNPTRPVRVRFAPSPTGSLHIGSLRTALFNWMFARHHGGTFVLRIEDTDQKRYDPDALGILMESLRWAGLDWDEGPEVGGAYGPYFQSERLDLYQKWAAWLVENDHAYPAYETPEELEAMRKEQEARKEQTGYNRGHRDLRAEQRAAYEAQGRTPVIRLKVPLDGETTIADAIHGQVTFENARLQDAVLLKADGFPTYHLAHVVDDHFMEISHVMRAVEWMPSAPIHWLLWEAFGWEKPVYMHLPVLLNPNGKGKISKRKPPVDAHGNLIPVDVHGYIREGYLPEAVLNFLANIGWNFGEDVEVFSIADAISRFDGTRINPANSAFPPEKLEWLNGVYIRDLSDDELAKRLRDALDSAGHEVNLDVLLPLVPLIKTRIKRITADEVMTIAGFLFRDEFPVLPREVLLKGFKGEASTAKNALITANDRLGALDSFASEVIEAALRALAEEIHLKPKDFFGLLRNALTGQEVSPPLFETMAIMGRETCLRRIADAAGTLE